VKQEAEISDESCDINGWEVRVDWRSNFYGISKSQHNDRGWIEDS